MKKSVIIAIIIAGVLVLGGGSVFAAGQIARSTAISEDSALNFALVDANVLPGEVEFSDIDFEFEKGKFVYDIEFLANGMKYEYTIDSKTGAIIEKEVEAIPGQTSQPTEASEVPEPSDAEMLSLDQAKVIALNAADIADGQHARITKAELETEDGKPVYDIEIVAGDFAEYEVTIDAYTGEILEKSYEEWDISDDQSDDANPIPVPDPQPLPSPDDSAPADDKAQDVISVDQAKAIALLSAGRSESNVIFSKVKLEYDDGVLIYDIEFYEEGICSYSYEIDAYSGKVLDEDIEPYEIDDDDDDEEDD